MRQFLLLLVIALSTPSAVARSYFQENMGPNGKPIISNFRQVTPSIYAGANPLSRIANNKGMEVLLNLRIAKVLNIQGGRDIQHRYWGRVAAMIQKGEHVPAIALEREFFESRGVTFLNFPLTSNDAVTKEEDLAIRKTLQHMHEASPLFPVYLHCEHGKDRTGLLIALYRITYEGWSYKEANAEWFANGHSWGSRNLVTGDLDKYFLSYANELALRQEKTPAAKTSDCERDLFGHPVYFD